MALRRIRGTDDKADSSDQTGLVALRDGCPGGETPAQVVSRAERIIVKVGETAGNVALFAHGHICRVLGARWIDLPASYGERFLLDTATLRQEVR